MQLGKNECRLLKFMIKFHRDTPVGWQTIGKDSINTMHSLAKKGFVIVRGNQATLNTNRTDYIVVRTDEKNTNKDGQSNQQGDE